MAANVGSMFQYWKRFDLRRLQVSAGSTGRAAVGSSSGAPLGALGRSPGVAVGRPGRRAAAAGAREARLPAPIDRY